MDFSKLLPQIGQGIQQGVQNVGNVVGNLPLISSLPTSPTIGGVASQIGKNIQNAGSGMGGDALFRQNIANNPQAQKQYTQLTGKPYVPPTQPELQAAKGGEQNMALGAMGGIKTVGDAALPEIKAVAQDVEQPIKNTWSAFIKNEGKQATGIKPNPDYIKGSSTPTKMSQEAAQLPDAEAINPRAIQPEGTTKDVLHGQQFWNQYGDLNPQEEQSLKVAGLDKFTGTSHAQEQFVQKVLARDVQGTTAAEKWQDIQPAENRIIQDAKNQVANQPNLNVQQQINPYIAQSVDQGIHDGIINPNERDLAIKGMNLQLYRLLGGSSSDSITPGQLFDARSNAAKAANQALDAAGQVKNNLNAPQAQSLYLKYALNNALYAEYPQVGFDLSKWGALEQAKNFVSKTRLNPPAQPQSLLGAVGDYVKQHPLKAVGVGGAAALGVDALNTIKNDIFGSNTSSAIGGAKNTTTPLYPDAKINTDLTIDPTPKAATTLSLPSGAMTYDQAQAIIGSNPPGSYAVLNAEKNYDLLKTSASTQIPQGIQAYMPLYPNAVTGYNNLAKYISNGQIDPDILLKAGVSIGNNKASWDQVQSWLDTNPNNSISKQLSTLANYSTDFQQVYQTATGQPAPQDLVPAIGDSPTQLKNKMAADASWMKHTYQQYQAPWEALHGSTQTQEQPIAQGQQPTQAQPMQQTLPPIANQSGYGQNAVTHASITGGSLPPITSFAQ